MSSINAVSPTPYVSPAASGLASDTGGTAVSTAVVGSSVSPSKPATTLSSETLDRFRSLTSTVLDTSGKYSYDERLQAYSSVFEMAVKGELRGGDAEVGKQLEKATYYSDIGTKARQIQEKGVAILISADSRGESTATAKLKFLAGLSDSDQKTNFVVTENLFDLAGNRQYADFDSYRNQLVANAAHDDPQGVGGAVKGLDSAAAGSSWSAHILSLFSSEHGGGFGSSASTSLNRPSVAPKMPLSYQPGNLFTRVA